MQNAKNNQSQFNHSQENFYNTSTYTPYNQNFFNNCNYDNHNTSFTQNSQYFNSQQMENQYFNSIFSPASYYQKLNYPQQICQNNFIFNINQQQQQKQNSNGHKQTLTQLSKPGKFFLGNDNIFKLNKYGYSKDQVYYIMNNIVDIKQLRQLMQIIKKQHEKDKNIRIDIVKTIDDIKNCKNDTLITSNFSNSQKNLNNIEQLENKLIDSQQLQDINNPTSLNDLQNYLQQKYAIKDQIGNGRKTIAEMIIDLWEIEKDESIDLQKRNQLLIIQFYEILKAQEQYYETLLEQKNKIIEDLIKEKQKPYQNQYTNNQYKGPIHNDQPNQFFELEHRKFLLPKEEKIIKTNYWKIRHCGTSIQYQGDIRDDLLWKDLFQEFQISNDEGGFNIVVFDPPWTLTGFNLDYETLNDQSWTNSIPLKYLQKSGFIFIWVTNGKLEQAQQFLDKNGYKRVDMIAWIKMKTNGVLQDGIGFYLRHMFELCLVGVKKVQYNELYHKYKIQNAPNVILSERQQSSRKPDAFYKIVEALAPNQQYLEIFGRFYNQGPNWVTVGNESIELLPKEKTPKEIAKIKKRNGIGKKEKNNQKLKKPVK